MQAASVLSGWPVVVVVAVVDGVPEPAGAVVVAVVAAAAAAAVGSTSRANDVSRLWLVEWRCRRRRNFACALGILPGKIFFPASA